MYLYQIPVVIAFQLWLSIPIPIDFPCTHIQYLSSCRILGPCKVNWQTHPLTDWISTLTYTCTGQNSACTYYTSNHYVFHFPILSHVWFTCPIFYEPYRTLLSLLLFIFSHSHIYSWPNCTFNFMSLLLTIYTSDWPRSSGDSLSHILRSPMNHSSPPTDIYTTSIISTNWLVHFIYFILPIPIYLN